MNNIWAGIIWLVVAVALCFLESVTVQLICIWFAGGAFVAMGAAFFGAPLYVQLCLFLIVSLLVLFLGRPFLKKRLTPKKTATNADALVGGQAVVLEEIDNSLGRGRVMVSGLDWAARTENEELRLPEKSHVRILGIEGVKLIVEPMNHHDNT